ncbi:MAG: ribosome-associated translation inhibitor RaiA [Clostridiales bacterium]|nr:ribosome-associated translation inhibitor RaiA [Clostridiales bacterium]
MKFTFTEKKIKVADELRKYAEKKIGKLDRFFRIESEAFITFDYERGRYKIEVTIKNNGMFYRVTEATSDMFATIDSAVAKIESQIRKHKSRLSKRLREGATDLEPRAVTLEPGAEEGEQEFRIVRTKRFPIKPMTPEEAILQMNLLEHTFFVFRNSENNDAFSVVYARNDGGYGLIEGDE